MTSMIFLLLLVAYLNSVTCTITEVPGTLSYTIGEDAVFKWNSTKDFVEVSWGLCKGGLKTISDRFVSVDSVLTVYNYAFLNNSRYHGRVSYNGDIAAGEAWFVIRNLSLADAVAYCVELREGPGVSPGPLTNSRVNLKVAATPAPTPSPATTQTVPVSVTPSSISPSPNQTVTPTPSTTVPSTKVPPNETPEPKKMTDAAIAGIVVAVVVVVGVAIGVGIYVYKKKKSGN